MIVPDTNLLLYAYREDTEFYDAARAWWEGLLAGRERIGIPWVVTSGFVRIMTNPRSGNPPISATQAIDTVKAWFENPCIEAINPGTRHMSLFQQNIEAAGVGGNLVTDAHIAALAMEHQAEVHTNDSDFGRFPGLKWRNPL